MDQIRLNQRILIGKKREIINHSKTTSISILFRTILYSFFGNLLFRFHLPAMIVNFCFTLVILSSTMLLFEFNLATSQPNKIKIKSKMKQSKYYWSFLRQSNLFDSSFSLFGSQKRAEKVIVIWFAVSLLIM